MNDLQNELQALKEKVAELESRIAAEHVKWQPKRGAYYIGSDGTTYNYANSVDKRRMFGHERQTEEQIKRTSIEMRKFNRLLALRDELCDGEVVNWLDFNKEKHCLCFSHNRGKWLVSADFSCERIAPYFTDYELAQKACDMLNSGEVIL